MARSDIATSDGTAPASVALSSSAARRIAEIARAEGVPPVLRVAVEGGGCSGFQYTFELVAEPQSDDFVVERDQARLVIDRVSLDYMGGAEVDFVDELIGASFRVRNPNATASCGCGTSFAI